MILINFKIYKEAWGEKAIELAKICKGVGEKYKIRIVVSTAAIDAFRIMKETGVEVWLQHVDWQSEGRGTGYISAPQAMEIGIKGSLLNHSEHKLAKGTILKTIKNRPKDFELMVCAHSKGQIEKWLAKAEPDWILYEPPELIASPDKSVATEQPEVIKNVVKLSKEVKVLVGAGIKSKSDVEVSLKEGAKGVGLSSAFVLSSEPRAVLEEIAKGFSIQ